MTSNPEKYSNQFRDELINDLNLTSSLSCPKCVITYVDNYQEGCCFYSGKKKPILNCIFDFENTIEKEAVNEWIYAVLKMIKREYNDELAEKWKKKFASIPYINFL